MLQRKISTLKRKFPSIPILKLRNKQLSLSNRNILTKYLRYVSSGIPLASFCALLLLSLMIINPTVSNNYGYALESEDAEMLEKEEDELEVEDLVESSVENAEEAEKTTAAPSSEDEVMVMSAENPVPMATLSVDGGLSQITPASAGDVSYRSQNVTINMQDVTDYTLQISYANGVDNALKFDGPITYNSTISNAENKTPTNMAENTWGYAWSDDTDSSEANLAYQTMPNYGSSVALKSESVANGNVMTKSVTGKLVFAAKFSSQAPMGHYKTQVLLSLAASPKTVLSSINTMQEVTTKLCSDASLHEAAVLKDIRDNAYYDVMKLDDNNCWMTQNLRLVNKSISSTDSDIESGSFTVKASAAPSSWTDTSTNANYVYYNNDTTNGAYYTWYTATAGTNLSSSGDATTSICPKGWRLPTNQEYKDLYGKSQSDTTGGRILGGGFFPYAGNVSTSELNYVGEDGYYWTSTSGNFGSAYYLVLRGGYASTQGSSVRNHGHSVRCIAK